VYVVFTTLQGMRLTEFGTFHPVLLRTDVPGIREKNWAPFVHQGVLHFVYSFDPLLVLYYDFNPGGILKAAYRDSSIP
jgi:hypothetical protein